MGHNAALYTVRVKRARKRKDKYVPLGNIDGNGTTLATAIYGLLPDSPELFAHNGHGTRLAWYEEAVLNDPGDGQEQGIDELKVRLQHGRSGEVANLTEDGEIVFRQRIDHEHQVPCALLFRLPRDQEQGWLVAHVNNGRSVYSLFARALYEQFRESFGEQKLLLELRPWVRVTALQQALNDDKLDEVRLIRLERPSDDAVAATNRWLNRSGRLEVVYSARTPARAARDSFLNADLLKRFLQSDDQDEKNAMRNQILEFSGMTFDQAQVVVELDNDKKKTYNIEKPDAGHVMTVGMDGIQLDDEGDPTDASLFRGLREALGEVD